jgi:hypothetical protein
MYHMTRVGVYIYIWRQHHCVLNHGTTLESIIAALEAADAVVASLRGLDEFQIEAVRPQRPELEAEMSVFNLAQKRSFSPLCFGHLRFYYCIL